MPCAIDGGTRRRAEKRSASGKRRTWKQYAKPTAFASPRAGETRSSAVCGMQKEKPQRKQNALHKPNGKEPTNATYATNAARLFSTIATHQAGFAGGYVNAATACSAQSKTPSNCWSA